MIEIWSKARFSHGKEHASKVAVEDRKIVP